MPSAIPKPRGGDLSQSGVKLCQSQPGTYPASTLRGVFAYLYLSLDLCSRKIVGWYVYAEASAEHVPSPFERARWRDAIGPDALVLNFDIGPP
jgi:hypothetical protein